ncbi:Gfo/Idh/MocA family oxidoreductase [Bacillus sp. FJAT-27251]|uniref:Gfo/Idh/MocA family protein n=1 Tax=Bacillus sp. FJAT-27251 TaxID=1684142 RepID=UPI0006A7CC77|nr:Gfo/Idh/MocA family oxidoreductase [Bacillus sp. FJAT-27251]
MIRFGIVGTNWITKQFIEAAKQHPDFTLEAVYSRTEEKAREFAGEYGVERIFTSLEQMAQSSEIDAVYIASPNSFHARQAVTFLENQKHVLCEKPLASNAAEVRQMTSAAKKHGVVLMEAMKSTLVPNFRVIADHLSMIGKVRRYFASYCQYSSRYDAYKEGNVLNAFKPEFSNGSLMDIGTYCVYPLVALFGRPERIQASGIILETGVDGEGSILLGYKDMEAVVMFSKITDSSLPFEIQGENGNISADKVNVPEQVTLTIRGKAPEDLTQQQNRKPLFYEVEEFMSLIKNNQLESRVNSHENSLLTMEIIDECRRQMGVVYPADSK